MTLTKRLNQFVREVAMLAVSELEVDKDLTAQKCIEEYTDQISSDDYYCVVNYANSRGVKIPVALRAAIDPEY